jgi:hypothetical protein
MRIRSADEKTYTFTISDTLVNIGPIGDLRAGLRFQRPEESGVWHDMHYCVSSAAIDNRICAQCCRNAYEEILLHYLVMARMEHCQSCMYGTLDRIASD